LGGRKRGQVSIFDIALKELDDIGDGCTSSIIR